MLLKIILTLIVSLILCCSTHVTDNGTGTDIGEAKIYGSVKLPGYKNGENVTVTLRKQSYIPFSISSHNQQRTISGKDGTFSITSMSKGYYLVELFNKDSLCAIKRFYISEFDTVLDLGDILLDTLALFTGKVLTDGLPASGADLLVMGMDSKITINDDGSFAIRLPSGNQLFRIIKEQTANDILFSDTNSGDTIRAYSTPVTIFDDFENRDGYNNLHALLGEGGWFAFTDQTEGGKSQILPTTDPGLVAAIDTSLNTYNNSHGSLHCIFQIDTTYSPHYALIGSDICLSKSMNNSRSNFDLSKMTALTFMAKGSGTIYVQFTCQPVVTPYVYTIYEIPIQLSADWEKVTIRASDIPNALLSSTNSQVVTWDQGNKAVSNINFLASRDAELWLDDITIEGMNPTDFLK